MKSILKNILFLSVVMISLLFISCQEEIIETNQEEPQTETFTAISPLANLLQRTSTLDGSIDNIIDGASCLSVELPVTVFVNGLQIIIDSEDDFEVIEAIFDQLSNDQDTLDILFPITIILNDYTEVVIQNQLELEEYISECFDNDDIECVDFVYPITYSVFDSAGNTFETVTINNDEEMYLFIENLEPTDIVSLNFPVTLIYFNGDTEEVNNNSELEEAIENAIDLCDENNQDLLECHYMYIEFQECDDDNDGIATFILETGGNQSQDCWDLYPLAMTTHPTYQDAMYGTNPMSNPVTTPLQLESQTIYVRVYSEVSQEYAIQELEINVEECNNSDCTEEEVDDYLMDCHWNMQNWGTNLSTYDLEFNENNKLIITNTYTGNSQEANWTTLQTSDGVELELYNIDYSSPNQDLDALVGIWLIIECDDDRFEMTKNSNVLVIEKDCSNITNDLNDIIVDGHWLVANFNNSGSDETSNYNDYELTFNSDGIVIAVNSNNTFSGTWSTTVNYGELKLSLEFDTQTPFDEFNNNWIVYDLNTDRIELKTLDGGGTIDDVLVFEKI